MSSKWTCISLLACLAALPAQEQQGLRRAFTVFQATQPSLIASADGKTLYFQLLGDLVALPVTGGAATMLTSGPAYDSWPSPSADGEYLYFLSDRAGHRNQIHRLRLADRSVEQITDLDSDLLELAMAPDGSTFVARLSRGSLWRSLPEGKVIREPLPTLRNIRLLADGSLIALGRETPGRQIMRAGPKGQEVVYEPQGARRIEWMSVSADARLAVVAESGPWDKREPDAQEILVIDLQEQKVLYRCADEAYSGADNQELRAAFVPGKVFIPLAGKIREVDLETGKAETMDWNARVAHRFPRRLNRSARAREGLRRIRGIGDIKPSPDGEGLVFAMLGDLFSAKRGEAPLQLTEGPAFDSQPVYGWDGEELFFARDGKLMRMPAEGGEAEDLQVNVSAGYFDYFAIANDGSKLVGMGSVTAPGMREFDFDRGEWQQLVPGRGGRGNWLTYPGYGSLGEEWILVGMAPGTRIPQVYRMEAGDEDPRPLTELRSAPIRAVASEDGAYLAFLRDGRAWIGARGEGLLGEEDFAALGEVGIHSLAFSADGQELWLGNGTRVSVFDCASGEELDSWELELALEPESLAEPLILEGFHVVDVEAGSIRENQRLRIEAGKIVAMDPVVGDPPADLRVIQGEGRFLMPGLFDMHVHQLGTSRAAMLAYGVTSVRQLGAVWPRQRVESELVDLRRRIGPREFSAGEIFEGARPFWGNIFHLIDSEAEALALVDRRAEQGADEFKLYMGLAREYQAPIIARAHARGVPVTAHVADLRALISGLSDGLDCVEHFPEGVPLLADDVIEFMRQGGVAFCPTLSVRGLGDFKQRLAAEELEEDLFRRAVDPMSLRLWKGRLKIDFSSDENLRALLLARARNVARAARKGLRVIVGSDSSLGNALLGPSTHWEIEALVMGGLSPREALFAATRSPAEYLGLRDVGALRPGFAADMVVLHANPLAEITNTRSVSAVLQAGRWYELESLLGN